MKFLVFQHVPHEHPGLIADIARKKRVQLEIIEFWKSSTMPLVEDADGLIIMGGPMGVYESKDKFSSKEDELTFIKGAIGKIPILGICLGSQLLAHALGANVHPNEKNGKRVKEIGYCDIDLTREGSIDPIFRGFTSPVKVLEWHGDAFDLPQGATLLGSSPDCANQAFRYGQNAYGVLFHFEFTPEMVENQIAIDKDWIHQDFDMNEEKLAEESRALEAQMKKQCETLFENFCALVASSA